MKSFHINLNYKFLYVFIIFNIFSYSFPCFSEIILKEEPKKNNNFWYKNIDKSDKNDFILFFNYFHDFIANLPTNLNVIDIESDIQSRIENKFKAEGNVVITFKGKQLKSDKFLYDKKNKKLTLIGNILFKKGSQYFEATKIYYDLENETGSINNIYGLINTETFNDDIGIKFNSNSNNTFNRKINDLEAFNNDSFGIVNKNNSNKTFNLNIPEINKWRFKSEKIMIEPNLIKSNEIFFTNDAYNKPQFFVESYDFKGQIKNEKIKFFSKNTWLNFDNKFKLPIGQSSFINGQDYISRWGFGYNNEDKDGFFIKRSLDNRKIFGNKNLKINSYFLMQRALKGETKSFYISGKSISENEIVYKNNFLDLFAIDTKLEGKLNNWNLDFKTSHNSLDLNKISESSRLKLNIRKSIDLNQSNFNPIHINKNKYSNKDSLLNLIFTSSYREKISKGFSGEEEIYWGNSFKIINQNYKQFNNQNINYSLLYEIGQFNAKSRDKEEFNNLFRNLFIGEFSQDIFIWRKKDLLNSINVDYKYTPTIISEGLNWTNSVKSGIFLYSNEAKQKIIAFSSGPQLTIGGLRKKFLDFTKFSSIATYIIKDGKSPYAFDDINDSFRIRFNLEQQLYGPIILNLESYLNLDNHDKEYGSFRESTFGLDLNRRAYKIRFFYKPNNGIIGLKFNIFNFNYSGIPVKFNK